MTGGAPRPLTLALDSAGSACSVVVAAGDRILADDHVESMHGQAERLLPMVDAAMRRAGFAAAALDVVAATVGPGSFTGIRVGLAAARGIALAVGAQLIGVTSFEAVAAGARRPNRDRPGFLLVALESRREDIYVQFFDGQGAPVGEPAATMPAALREAVDAVIGAEPLLIAGAAAHRAGLVLSDRPDTTALTSPSPSAGGVLRAALRRLGSGEQSDAARPLYLRPPDVTLSSGGRIPDLSRA